MAIATCAVVGAGISGLSAAAVLRGRGVSVAVLEKSRGVGGITAPAKALASGLDVHLAARATAARQR